MEALSLFKRNHILLLWAKFCSQLLMTYFVSDPPLAESCAELVQLP